MREKEGYRDLLEDILTVTEGKRLLNVTDVSKYTGQTRRTVAKRYPFTDGYIAAPILARILMK